MKLHIKKIITSVCIAFFSFSPAWAADLLQAYADALISDPIYQQAIAQQFADAQGVPINLAALLPQATATLTPNYSRITASGSANLTASHRTKGYDANLTLNQTIFDLGKFSKFKQARYVEKGAYATLNAATQDLMIRVSRAYMQVLQDEDTLRAQRSARDAYAKQLEMVREQYRVGIKTITDFYMAKASYESAVAATLGAEAKLASDHQFLTAITGVNYCHLAKLSEKFPLIKPCPFCMEEWVRATLRHNWQIKSAQYARCAAMENIRVQKAGHFPTLNFQLTQDNVSTSTWGDNSLLTVNGSQQTHTTVASVALGIPIFTGGLVTALTEQARYQYLVSSEQLEKQIRDVVTLSRQSFLNVVAGITQVKADRQAIIAGRSSLIGMEASYIVGTTTLFDVLNQRQILFNAERTYAIDRYAYVINFLLLKQATGLLSYCDLASINGWLTTHHEPDSILNDTPLDLGSGLDKLFKSQPELNTLSQPTHDEPKIPAEALPSHLNPYPHPENGLKDNALQENGLQGINNNPVNIPATVVPQQITPPNVDTSVPPR